MPANLLPLFSYVMISTFTPGPSNISTASNSVLHGYKTTLPYQFGLALGVFLLMFLSGSISLTLLQLVPALESALRYIGAAYILYLAYKILRASYTFTDTVSKPFGIVNGVMLNLLNPKLYFYAFTVFTGFLAPITNNLLLVAFAALALALVSFVATSVWALFGSVIKTYLRRPRWILVINIMLALLLVWSAIALTGLI